MADEDNFVLAHLNAIRADVADMKAGQRVMLGRLSNLESSIAGLRRDMASVEERVVLVNQRLDRLSDRLKRIEDRLWLRDRGGTH